MHLDQTRIRYEYTLDTYGYVLDATATVSSLFLVRYMWIQPRYSLDMARPTRPSR